MKRLYTLILLLATCLMAQAQFTTDGYYRVQNWATSRYIYLTDNTGSYDMGRDIGDLNAVELWRNRPTVSDPASVIYIKKINTGGEYDLMGQGCGVHAITGMYVHVKEVGQNEYNVYGVYQGVSKYLGDSEMSNLDQGFFATTAKGDYRIWSIYKYDPASDDQCFGLTPTVTAASRHFYPLYMAMPFTLTEGMKAYTISRVDQGMAVLHEVTGTIPALTPVLIECASTTATANRLNLLPPSTTAPLAGNKLRGVLFCNQERITKSHAGKTEQALTRFDAQTMRVLGVTSQGRLGFITSHDPLTYCDRKIDGTPIGYCLPANQAYLPVEAGTAAELNIVTEAEYQAYIEANRTYTLTFTIDGQTYLTATYKRGETIVAPTPEREGYTFEGWQDLPPTMPDHDLTVAGTFAVNHYTLLYKVDGTPYQTFTVPYGTTLTPIAAPKREGYTFSGWTGLPQTMPAHDVEVNGTFTPRPYTLLYTVDGEPYETLTVPCGTPLTPIAEPASREGHTFEGWYGLPDTMPARNIEVRGFFRVNTYAVAYRVGEKTVHTDSVQYAQPIPDYVYVPADPQFVFMGWACIDGQTYTLMPAHDLTYVAQLTSAIDEVNGQRSTVNTPVYDLTGRRLTGVPAHGYYLRGGRLYYRK